MRTRAGSPQAKKSHRCHPLFVRFWSWSSFCSVFVFIASSSSSSSFFRRDPHVQPKATRSADLFLVSWTVSKLISETKPAPVRQILADTDTAQVPPQVPSRILFVASTSSGAGRFRPKSCWRCVLLFYQISIYHIYLRAIDLVVGRGPFPGESCSCHRPR